MYRIRASRVAVLLVIIMITLTACSPAAMEAPPTPTTVPPTPTTPPPTPTTPPPTPTNPPDTAAPPSPNFTSVGTVTLSKTDCVLNANGPIEAGPIAIKATNNMDSWAGFDMWRITEGHSYDELEKVIQEAKEQAEAGLEGSDHPAYLANPINIFLQAGETRDLRGVVVPGTYAIVCLQTFPQVGEMRPFSLVGPLEVK